MCFDEFRMRQKSKNDENDGIETLYTIIIGTHKLYNIYKRLYLL